MITLQKFTRTHQTVCAWLLICGCLSARTAIGHPLKLSASLIEYKQDTKTLQVEAKVFVDDFERSLFSSILKDVNPATLDSNERIALKEKYFEKFYRININQELIKLALVSTEIVQPQNVLIIRFDANQVEMKKGDNLRIQNILFFKDFGPKQTNRTFVRLPHFNIDDAQVSTIYDHSLQYILGD